jgi:hypothetical protein
VYFLKLRSRIYLNGKEEVVQRYGRILNKNNIEENMKIKMDLSIPDFKNTFSFTRRSPFKS